MFEPGGKVATAAAAAAVAELVLKLLLEEVEVVAATLVVLVLVLWDVEVRDVEVVLCVEDGLGEGVDFAGLLDPYSQSP